MCVFQDYYYHIYEKIGTNIMYLDMFYSKIPDPWGSALIREYHFVSSDTLGRRISFLKEKLSHWCHQAYLIKKSKTIRRDNVLCCKGNDLITIIGDLKKGYKKKKRGLDILKDLTQENILLKENQDTSKENPGLIKSYLFIEETLIRLKNAGAILVINMYIMPMNDQKDLTKRKLN